MHYIRNSMIIASKGRIECIYASFVDTEILRKSIVTSMSSTQV